uniref:Uncharacterized protein n=1 Tax=Arundo donax TaxID=35708 RepID=A0A0A9H5G5_ARUDO
MLTGNWIVLKRYRSQPLKSSLMIHLLAFRLLDSTNYMTEQVRSLKRQGKVSSQNPYLFVHQHSGMQVVLEARNPA